MSYGKYDCHWLFLWILISLHVNAVWSVFSDCSTLLRQQPRLPRQNLEWMRTGMCGTKCAFIKHAYTNILKVLLLKTYFHKTVWFSCSCFCSKLRLRGLAVRVPTIYVFLCTRTHIKPSFTIYNIWSLWGQDFRNDKWTMEDSDNPAQALREVLKENHDTTFIYFFIFFLFTHFKVVGFSKKIYHHTIKPLINHLSS